jgi:hypothetical protein
MKSRIIRIGISFLITFIVINVAVEFFLPSYKNTLRASEILLGENVCNFDIKDFLDIEEMLKNDEKDKIIILGDSVAYGIAVADESDTVSGITRKRHSEYSVYNLSSCGSKPLDFYLWIQYLNDLDLEGENLFIIQYNYKSLNNNGDDLEDRISQKLILEKFNDYHDEDASQIDFFLKKYIPVYGHKNKLFIQLFGAKNVKNLINKNEKNTFEYKSKPWFEKDEYKNFKCKIAYGENEWDEDDYNYQTYLKTIDFIDNENLHVTILIPSYNYSLIRKCADDKYYENWQKIRDAAKKTDNVEVMAVLGVNDNAFIDDVHLRAENNDFLYDPIKDTLLFKILFP